MEEKTLPFGIEFVIDQNLAKMDGFSRSKTVNGSFYINCPFCSDNKKKCNINIHKNVGRCNKCGTTFNTVTLHARLTGLSTKEATKDLYNRWNGLSSDAKVQLNNLYVASAENSKVYDPASIEFRDAMYRRFLDQLELSQEHYKDLIKRGLTDEDIKKGNYKTVPKCGFKSIASNAYNYAKNFEKIKAGQGVPGFYDLNNEPKCCQRKNGYFIPVKTKEGLISGMQIRYDNLPGDASEEQKDNYAKYTWFSSSEKDKGCCVTGCENIHYAGIEHYLDEIRTINLTEGVLKSDIASILSGKPFMGLVGVNNVSQLRYELSVMMSRNKLETVNICVDMDYREKKEVASALANIKKIINSAGQFELKDNFVKTDGDLNIFKEDNWQEKKECVRITSDKKFPEKSRVEIYLDNMDNGDRWTLVPSELYEVSGNQIAIDHKFMTDIRNCSHRLYVAELSDSGDHSLFGKITFTKNGLQYRMFTWDPEFKGIDDFLLHRKLSRNK